MPTLNDYAQELQNCRQQLSPQLVRLAILNWFGDSYATNKTARAIEIYTLRHILKLRYIEIQKQLTVSLSTINKTVYDVQQRIVDVEYAVPLAAVYGMLKSTLSGVKNDV